MPIFECEQCYCIENTALSGYWNRNRKEDKRALCSECDPKINKWHGSFDKDDARGSGLWVAEDGFLYSNEHPPHHTKLVRAV